MSQSSPALSLPYIQASQAQKHVTHNEALRLLDLIVQPVVIDAGLVTPPASPVTGDRYIVAPGGTAAWAGQDGAIAAWDGTGWIFAAPQAGWQARDRAGDTTLYFDGATWAADTLTAPATWGINASADATNRLSVSAPAVLLNHEGAGHQLKVNKATAADTASLLFQTGFSGRAEMGTAGGDDFSIKVSADGAAWSEPLRAQAATGILDLPEQPYFMAHGSGGWTTVTTTDTDLVLGTISDQRGSSYDGVTGLFTAPVDGLYGFLLNGLIGAASNGRVAFSRNGVTQTTQLQALDGVGSLSFHTILALTAGDTVTCRTGDVNTNLTYHADHTTFSGWKVF